MKENVDYHIRPVGKTLELTSMIIPGYAAGIADLTARGYKINYNTATSIGGLLVANTMPKNPKAEKKPAKTTKTKKKVDKKVKKE